MRVLPYRSEYRDELRAVCLATASERARTDAVYGQFTLLMYCEPYLEHGTCFMLIDGNDTACGYVLCAEDFQSWQHTFKPYQDRIAALGAEYAQRAANEFAYYESVAEEYPAHLHIDIVEDHTGKGGGRMLMQTLLDHLRGSGVRGISFGVAAANKRAVGFYRHMGFVQLTTYEDTEEAGVTFAMQL